MFTTLISLALENLLYLALHIEGISSFPKPLSAADEKKYFDLYENGDINARNTLIEHNLRLVAHIVKKYYKCLIVGILLDWLDNNMDYDLLKYTDGEFVDLTAE